MEYASRDLQRVTSRSVSQEMARSAQSAPRLSYGRTTAGPMSSLRALALVESHAAGYLFSGQRTSPSLTSPTAFRVFPVTEIPGARGFYASNAGGDGDNFFFTGCALPVFRWFGWSATPKILPTRAQLVAAATTRSSRRAEGDTRSPGARFGTVTLLLTRELPAPASAAAVEYPYEGVAP